MRRTIRVAVALTGGLLMWPGASQAVAGSSLIGLAVGGAVPVGELRDRHSAGVQYALSSSWALAGDVSFHYVFTDRFIDRAAWLRFGAELLFRL